MIGAPAIINVMMAAKKKAARRLIRDFNEIQYLRSSQRPLDDFVKHAQLKIEQMLVEELKLARPDFGIKSMVSGASKGSDANNYWVINSLSGKDNFIYGLPYFAITIAHQEIKSDGNSQIMASLIDAPACGETYFAAKSYGAWVERNSLLASDTLRLKVSTNKDPLKALIITTRSNLSEKYNTRIFGCPSLSMAYVAWGKADVFVANDLNICEIAAGLLLVQEAGGNISKTQESAEGVVDRLVVSNLEIAPRLDL